MIDFKSFIKTKPLYVSRPLLNKKEVMKWAEEQGFDTTLQDMHVTICFSKSPVKWAQIKPETHEITINVNSDKIKQFGDAFVLTFDSSELEKRWKEFMDIGASWDHNDYHPHITISYSKPKNINNIKPFDGKLIFGPEKFKIPDLNWKDKAKEI